MTEIVQQIGTELRLLDLEHEHVAGMREDVGLLLKSANLRRDGEAAGRYEALMSGYTRDLGEIEELLEQIRSALARRSEGAADRAERLEAPGDQAPEERSAEETILAGSGAADAEDERGHDGSNSESLPEPHASDAPAAEDAPGERPFRSTDLLG